MFVIDFTVSLAYAAVISAVTGGIRVILSCFHVMAGLLCAFPTIFVGVG